MILTIYGINYGKYWYRFYKKIWKNNIVLLLKNLILLNHVLIVLIYMNFYLF